MSDFYRPPAGHEPFPDQAPDVDHQVFFTQIIPGHTAPLGVKLQYYREDPLAIDLLIGKEEMRWTFGRELLADGLHQPTGEGDISIAPGLDGESKAMLSIKLYPDDALKGREYWVYSNVVVDFLFETYKLVPRGEESARYGFDQLTAEQFIDR
jgi:hypothetical protein